MASVGRTARSGRRTGPAIGSCWVLTDGKAGDEQQCLGVAEALGVAPQVRRVVPRPPWAWLMPWGPIDPHEAPERPASPIRPPFPDLLIASGRRAVAYVRAVRAASKGATFTVILKDPRTGAGAADFIWVPEHDRLRGANVLATPTSPHRVSAERLAAARAAPPAAAAALPPPRIAVLLGGDSRAFRFTDAANRRLADALRASARAMPGAAFMVTPSRRTPAATLDAVRAALTDTAALIWDGAGDNPYLAFLALADAIIVTADSVNMVGEAAATGAPVHVFRPDGGNAKTSRFLAALCSAGAIRMLDGAPADYVPVALDATPRIAAEIMRRMAARDSREKSVGK